MGVYLSRRILHCLDLSSASFALRYWGIMRYIANQRSARMHCEKEPVPPTELLDVLVRCFERRFNLPFKRSGLTDAEQKLAQKLYDVKYSTERWHVEGNTPLLALTGETFVALYVANPPTSKCRQLI